MKVSTIISWGPDAHDVAAHLLGVKRLELYSLLDKELPEEPFKRLQEGEPAAYIIGHVDFFGCFIAVNPHVLIPRQETEQLVAKIVNPRGRLLDLCSGSGAIGLSLKKKYPELEVVLADISEEALAVARSNAKTNEVTVELVQSNFLEGVEGLFDHIVCNPPYVTEEEWQDIDTKDFEPRIAFIGGLDFYRQLAAKAGFFMKPGGTLWLEIGASQGEAVKALFAGLPHRLEKDWAGHDRFLLVFY